MSDDRDNLRHHGSRRSSYWVPSRVIAVDCENYQMDKTLVVSWFKILEARMSRRLIVRRSRDSLQGLAIRLDKDNLIKRRKKYSRCRRASDFLIRNLTFDSFGRCRHPSEVLMLYMRLVEELRVVWSGGSKAWTIAPDRLEFKQWLAFGRAIEQIIVSAL